MSERESALDEFKTANMSTMMKDLAIDKKSKEPWTGPGRDPRDDKWAPENEPTTNPGDEEDDDEDSGEDIDRRTYFFPPSFRSLIALYDLLIHPMPASPNSYLFD